MASKPEQAYCWCGHGEDAHDAARHGIMGGAQYEVAWCYACDDEFMFNPESWDSADPEHEFKYAA